MPDVDLILKHETSFQNKTRDTAINKSGVQVENHDAWGTLFNIKVKQKTLRSGLDAKMSFLKKSVLHCKWRWLKSLDTAPCYLIFKQLNHDFRSERAVSVNKNCISFFSPFLKLSARKFKILS